MAIVIPVAAAVSIQDAGNYYTAPKNVENALQQIAAGAVAVLDQYLFFGGKPAASELLFEMVAIRDMFIAAGASGSTARIGVNPTGTLTLTLLLNGVSAGTLDFDNTGVATWTVAAQIDVSAGDRLGIAAPGSQDATGADIDIGLKWAIA
jgi:hypothetical protein